MCGGSQAIHVATLGGDKGAIHTGLAELVAADVIGEIRVDGETHTECIRKIQSRVGGNCEPGMDEIIIQCGTHVPEAESITIPVG